MLICQVLCILQVFVFVQSVLIMPPMHCAHPSQWDYCALAELMTQAIIIDGAHYWFGEGSRGVAGQGGGGGGRELRRSTRLTVALEGVVLVSRQSIREMTKRDSLRETAWERERERERGRDGEGERESWSWERERQPDRLWQTDRLTQTQRERLTDWFIDWLIKLSVSQRWRY